MMAIGVITVVMMVSGLRVMWRRDRPVRTAVSPKTCVVTVAPWWWCRPIMRRCRRLRPRGTSSRVGCFLDVFDLGRREQLLELGEGAVHDDPALVEDRDPVGESFGLLQVLRREQHRRAVSGEFLDGLPTSIRASGSSPAVGSSRRSPAFR